MKNKDYFQALLDCNNASTIFSNDDKYSKEWTNYIL